MAYEIADGTFGPAMTLARGALAGVAGTAGTQPRPPASGVHVLDRCMELVRYPSDAPEDRTLTDARRPDLSNARLGLTAVERLAVEELVSGAPGETADFVATRASALADDPEGACRRRTLAKALAVQDALGAQLTALLARAVAQRDDAAVRLLDRALSGCTNRLRMLAEELRAETLGGRKAVVQVGLAGTVNIHGGEG